jgi:hypothetical protein
VKKGITGSQPTAATEENKQNRTYSSDRLILGVLLLELVAEFGPA